MDCDIWSFYILDTLDHPSFKRSLFQTSNSKKEKKKNKQTNKATKQNYYSAIGYFLSSFALCVQLCLRTCATVNVQRILCYCQKSRMYCVVYDSYGNTELLGIWYTVPFTVRRSRQNENLHSNQITLMWLLDGIIRPFIVFPQSGFNTKIKSVRRIVPTH